MGTAMLPESAGGNNKEEILKELERHWLIYKVQREKQIKKGDLVTLIACFVKFRTKQ